MHPVSVQQMLSERTNVCEEKQLEGPSRNSQMLPGIFQGTYSEWEEKSKVTKDFSEKLQPRG